MLRPRVACELIRHMGPRWVAYRAWLALQQKTGALERRMPVRSWDAVPLAGFLSDAAEAVPERYVDLRRNSKARFFFGSSQRGAFRTRLAEWDTAEASPVTDADRIVRGEWPFFSHTWLQIGNPPDWHRNAFTGQSVPADRHWSRIGDFDTSDIKVVWEPNRFGVVYTLVRAHWRTGSAEYAELFWRLIEDWRAKNPPNTGPNWRCGQEITFRLMAWCFGLYGFAEAKTSTPERIAMLAQMIAVSGERIAAHLHYALSQKNNHGISEAVGLWTIGLLFPDIAKADRWRELGREAIESQARELIYDDGAFSQHSANYHRVMLHDYTWALRLGALNNAPLSDELRRRVGSAVEFLVQIQEPESGRVPCYGPNDGALVLSLTNCDYRDFRPVIQSAGYASLGRRVLGAGPWDEELLWLGGIEALDAPVEGVAVRNLRADQGGCYTLRSPRSWVFVRCPRYRHRPAHADALHVDLWWRGQNIAIGPGSYSYNAPPPWDHGLADAMYHNAVTVDGREPMEYAGRFLWLPWMQGTVRVAQTIRSGATREPGSALIQGVRVTAVSESRTHREERAVGYWEGEHDGYSRLSAPVRHRRGVLQLGEEAWLVLDRLESQGPHEYRLHWLLEDFPVRGTPEQGYLDLSTPQGLLELRMAATSSACETKLVRADPVTPHGWQAPYYQDRQPALSWSMSTRAETCWFWTLFGAAPTTLRLRGESLDASVAGLEMSIGLTAGSRELRA